MGRLLGIVGTVWAALGALNLYLMDWDRLPEQVQTYGIMHNVLLFILPGLICAGIGSHISKKMPDAAPATPTGDTGSTSARLEQLEALRAAGAITPQEYEAKRTEILKAL